MLFQMKYADLLLRHEASPNVNPTQLESAFCYCMRFGQLDVVYLLLNYGVDFNALDFTGGTSLFCAAQEGLTDIAEILLMDGSDINHQDRDGWIPLFHALTKSKWEVADLLLDHDSNLGLKSDFGETALHVVVRYPKWPIPEEILKRIIEDGVDKEACTDDGMTALSQACESNVHAVKALVKAGCDLNGDGQFILYQIAFASKDTQELRDMSGELIEAGADVDRANYNGITPLVAAIYGENTLMIKALLQANCNPDIVTKEHPLCERKNLLFCFLCQHRTAMDYAVYLLVDCCYEVEKQAVQNYFFKSVKKQIQGLEIDISKYGSPPIPLYRLCRVAVRALLPRGNTFPRAVDKLPLPKSVKDFVAFRTN